MALQFRFIHKDKQYEIDRKAQYVVLEDGTLLKVMDDLEEIEKEIKKEEEEAGMFDSCVCPYYPSALRGEIDVKEIYHIFTNESAERIAGLTNGVIARKIG